MKALEQIAMALDGKHLTEMSEPERQIARIVEDAGFGFAKAEGNWIVFSAGEFPFLRTREDAGS